MAVNPTTSLTHKVRVRVDGSSRQMLPITVAGEKCKYEKNDWSECNEATNQQTRTMTLKTGKSLCSPEKTITRKCKKGQTALHAIL